MFGTYQGMGSSLNEGPLIGPKHSTLPLEKRTPKGTLVLENHPKAKALNSLAPI